MFFAGNKFGPGLTFDSINYIFAGEHFFYHGSLLRPGNKPYMEWAPGYPLLISLLRGFSKDIEGSIFIFNCLLSGASAYLIGIATLKKFENLNLFTLFYLSIIFGTPVILVNHFVWSESVFVFLSILFFIFLSRYIQDGPSKICLIYITVAGALLSLDRQATIFFLPGGAVCLLLLQGKITRRVISHTLLFYFFSSLPTLIWVVRNKIISGDVMPNYDITGQTSFTDHLIWHHDILTSWFMPDEIPLIIRVFAFYTVVMLMLFPYFKKDENLSFEKNKTLTSSFIIFFSYFLLTYLFCSYINHPSFDEERYLSIVYIFGMLSFFLLLDNIIRSGFIIVNRKIIHILIALWLFYPVVRAIYNVNFWHNVSRPHATGKSN